MASRLSASPSSHLPNMSQEERLEFSIFLSGIKTGSGAGFWDGTEASQEKKGSSVCVCVVCINIYQVKLSVSLNQHW